MMKNKKKLLMSLYCFLFTFNLLLDHSAAEFRRRRQLQTCRAAAAGKKNSPHFYRRAIALVN